MIVRLVLLFVCCFLFKNRSSNLQVLKTMEIVSAFFSGGQIVIEMLFASVNGNVSPQSTFSKQFQQ